MAHAGYYPKKRIWKSKVPDTVMFNFWSCCGTVEIKVRDIITDGDTCIFSCGCKPAINIWGNYHQPIHLPAYNVYWRILSIWQYGTNRRLDTEGRKDQVLKLLKWVDDNRSYL